MYAELTKWLKTDTYSSVWMNNVCQCFLGTEDTNKTKLKICAHKAYVIVGQTVIHNKYCVRKYQVLWKTGWGWSGEKGLKSGLGFPLFCPLLEQ